MIEMVSLDLDGKPDWAAAEAFIDSLVLEEVGEEVLETCGVDPDADPTESWLDTVKERLRSDLARFRDDIETDRDVIEVWEAEEALILASVGTLDDERDPDSGHGWMCRLVDGGALAAAGFKRLLKADLYRFA